jgi:aldehyde dehydrogenase (NAD+)
MRDFLTELGIESENPGASDGSFFQTSGSVVTSTSPADGQVIAKIKEANEADYERVMRKAHAQFETWRMLPAPKRGEIVRQMGVLLRDKKKALAKLVSLEMGKILPEGEGEVQEMIDIADFAVGLSLRPHDGL